ncbi:uncharacterized protein DS421_18g632300 [Arachis hypogaea]|nr:uncharacterized protein DS421_18g632300 [Arachis hypogaea]
MLKKIYFNTVALPFHKTLMAKAETEWKPPKPSQRRLCARSLTNWLTASPSHSSLSCLFPRLDSHHSQSLTTSLRCSLSLSPRSSSRSRAPTFGSSAAEADGTSQATAAPSGGGRRHLVPRQSRCRNQSIRILKMSSSSNTMRNATISRTSIISNSSPDLTTKRVYNNRGKTDLAWGHSFDLIYRLKVQRNKLN